MNNPEKVTYVAGSGNVYADLGIDDADEHFTRAQNRFSCLS